MPRNLSRRAWEILLLIDEHCDQETGVFWVPGPDTQHVIRLDRTIWVNGGGDARIVRSFWRRGLTKEKTVAPYASEITEEGRKLIEDAIANGAIPLKLRD